MAQKRCPGRYTLDDVVGEVTETSHTTLEEMAKAAAEFPSIFRDEGFSAKSALELVLDQARKKADEWCGGRNCNTGDCHVFEPFEPIEYDILDKTVSKIQEGEFAGLEFHTVTIKLKAVRCVCKNIKPIALRQKGEEDYKVVMLKEQMKDIGLTPAQIKKIDESLCEIQRVAMGKENKEVGVKCAREVCGVAKECKIVLYKIGDNNDQGRQQASPFPLKTLPQGHYVVCECKPQS
jgi:hypothetical protein